RQLRVHHPFPTRRSSDLDPELDRVPQPGLDDVGAGLVPLEHRPPAPLGPAAVAIGDDGHVSSSFGRAHTSRISASFCLSRPSSSDRKSTRLNSSHVKISY